MINVGNDSEITINKLAQEVISLTSSKSEIKYLSYKDAYGEGFEDMERRVPGLNLIKDLVGWSPTRNLSTIITDIAAEMKDRA